MHLFKNGPIPLHIDPPLSFKTQGIPNTFHRKSHHRGAAIGFAKTLTCVKFRVFIFAIFLPICKKDLLTWSRQIDFDVVSCQSVGLAVFFHINDTVGHPKVKLLAHRVQVGLQKFIVTSCLNQTSLLK